MHVSQCVRASMHVCDCGLVLQGLIKMPLAIWKMTAVGSLKGSADQAEHQLPAPAPVNLNMTSKGKFIFAMTLSETRAPILYNEGPAFH